MPSAELHFIAAGGNRHPSAADWKPGLLAFGSGHNIALWNPEEASQKGIFALLAGHTDGVNAVKIFDGQQGRRIISGSADKTIRIWKELDRASFEQVQCMVEHQGSVNLISVLPDYGIFASGSADGTVKIWDFSDGEAKLVQTISLKPRYLPLTCAMTRLFGGRMVLAVAGTSTSIQVYTGSKATVHFELQATLTGHEGWIRSLDFAMDGADESSDILLASASQDKYIRLWRLHRSRNAPSTAVRDSVDATLATPKKSLSNKAHQVGGQHNVYSVTFEALLIGHEDWIYTARWAPPCETRSSPTLMSASADSSIAIWRVDELSGVWVCQTRLGEISSQKGSTTATGSTGGFWIGLWQPNGQSVASLGRTGSWRRWEFDSSSDLWLQKVGVSGHTLEVQGCAWAPDGPYLLSTGSDQTTRLFAEWKRDGERSWHEFARPQIHGYDLNCIDAISSNRFISGADEKLLRVFNKPGAIDHLLSKLCGIESSTNGELPDAANIPVLGLSNKAITPAADEEVTDGTLMNGVDEQQPVDVEPAVRKSTLELDHPPFEEHLARRTIWPEHEKLYGHGYEISAVAASHDGSLVATACKASSIDHAVIRIYECARWREMKPPLIMHSLTVTSLQFSPDDQYLLSVGRDRTLAVFRRDENTVSTYKLSWSNPKGHTRMILDCSWAPSETRPIFATAGRDKVVKVWRLVDGEADCSQSVSATAPVTAVSFANRTHTDSVRFAYGTEEGIINIVDLAMETLEVTNEVHLERHLQPSRGVNSLRWRPAKSIGRTAHSTASDISSQLAAASDDHSLRIFNVGPCSTVL